MLNLEFLNIERGVSVHLGEECIFDSIPLSSSSTKDIRDQMEAITLPLTARRLSEVQAICSFVEKWTCSIARRSDRIEMNGFLGLCQEV